MGDLRSMAAMKWRERLNGDRAREDWRRVLEQTWSRMLEQPLASSIPPDALVAAIESYLEPDVLLAFVRPLARQGLADLARDLSSDSAPVGRFVPDAARAALERIAMRPGVVHPDWVRMIFRESAVEQVLSDTIYRSLRDFSTIIPRLVIGALPKARILGLAGNLTEKIAQQIESLVEPEIRSFIATSSQRALERAADFAIGQLDSPASIDMRRDIVRFVLSKSSAFHAQSLTQDALRDVDSAAEIIAEFVASNVETRERIRSWVHRVADAVAERPLKDVLRSIDAEFTPPFEALANASWPAVSMLLSTPAVETWLCDLIEEIRGGSEVQPGSHGP